MRPQARLSRLAAVAAAACIAVSLSAARSPVQAEPLFRHGINVTRLFDTPDRSPQDGTLFAPWTREISPDELKRLRAAGFDFIRLPISPAVLLGATERMREQGIDAIFDFLEMARRDGFAVIVDLHAMPGGDWAPASILTDPSDPKFVQYEALATAMAARLGATHDRSLALELMNEPQAVCAKPSRDWTMFQAALHASARSAAPALPLVVTGGCNSSVDGLANFDAAALRDRNIYVMVHFYEPHFFTHQGAPWSPLVRSLAGLRYPPDPEHAEGSREASEAWIRRQGLDEDTAESDAQQKIDSYYGKPFGPREIAARLGIAAAWADSMGIPRNRIIIGEFGVMSEGGGLGNSPDALTSRAAWLHDVSHAADALGFGWAVWGYHGGFGIVSDDARRELDPDVLQALFAR